MNFWHLPSSRELSHLLIIKAFLGLRRDTSVLRKKYPRVINFFSRMTTVEVEKISRLDFIFLNIYAMNEELSNVNVDKRQRRKI